MMQAYREIEDSAVTDSHFPWLIFEISGKRFAVNSGVVMSILQYPAEVSTVPDASPYLRGIFHLRGMMISLLDLRLIFGYPSMQEEYQKFIEMLEIRKHDHVHWVNELEHSVKENRKFTLATDPHKCAFGKWYDSYHSESDSVNVLLSRIDEPHRKLHEAALDVQRCSQKCDECKREECLKATMERVKGQHVPTVLQLLDEAKETFRASYREMVVILESADGQRVGIIVDEVLAVDQITPVDTSEVSRLYETQYIVGMGESKAISGNILLLDENKLLRFF